MVLPTEGDVQEVNTELLAAVRKQINFLVGNIQALREETEGPVSEDLSRLSKSGKLLYLTNQLLLDSLSFQAGTLVLSLAKIDVRAELLRLLRLFDTWFKFHQVTPILNI
jgi:hypothetical protein